MKSLIYVVAALCALAFSTPAQCFGNYPVGTIEAPGAMGARCTDIPGATQGPFVVPAGPLVSTIGVVRLYWSEIPGNDPNPIAVVALDAGLSSPFGFAGCFGHVLPNLMLVSCTIDATQPGCQTSAVLTVPPAPWLAGLQFYGQGYMVDTTASSGVGVSNVFLTTIQ